MTHHPRKPAHAAGQPRKRRWRMPTIGIGLVLFVAGIYLMLQSIRSHPLTFNIGFVLFSIGGLCAIIAGFMQDRSDHRKNDRKNGNDTATRHPA